MQSISQKGSSGKRRTRVLIVGAKKKQLVELKSLLDRLNMEVIECLSIDNKSNMATRAIAAVPSADMVFWNPRYSRKLRRGWAAGAIVRHFTSISNLKRLLSSEFADPKG